MDALNAKLAPACVDELIANGEGNKFNFTRKTFKEWVITPRGRGNDYEG